MTVVIYNVTFVSRESLDGGDAFRGVAYQASLDQFVSAAAASRTSTVSARLMISTASGGAPVSRGVESVKLWSGPSTATTRTGTASSSFFARVATTRKPSRSTV